MGTYDVFIEVVLGLLLIPYITWTVTSIFSMRQELAILKNNNELNKEIYELLKSRLI